MPAPFFVISSSADHKLINRVLLHLRDWEYGEEPTWDNFQLITTSTLPQGDGTLYTTPSLTGSALSNNEWKEKSISDIETFMLSEGNKKIGLNLNTFIVLDDQGVEDGTVVLLDRLYDDEEEKLSERFNKVRVPWAKAYIIWCNLDIANMNFEDFVEEEDDDQPGWWTYMVDEVEEDESVKEKRQNAIEELEQKDLA